MKILSIDTSSDVCGVSILEDTKLICNLDSNTGRTHSENLLPLIDQALKNTNLSMKDIGLLVCDVGPGSFTGIRIGIATTKAFNDSLDIPSVGISSLEVLAYNTINTDVKYVCCIIDCKNNNCYFALYEKNNNVFDCLIEPQAESVESALSILKSYCDDSLNKENITFIGDGSAIYQNYINNYFSNANFINTNLNTINSYSLGIAGFNYYNSNDDINNIEPLYLKKPQAQRQLEERQG